MKKTTIYLLALMLCTQADAQIGIGILLGVEALSFVPISNPTLFSELASFYNSDFDKTVFGGMRTTSGFNQHKQE